MINVTNRTMQDVKALIEAGYRIKVFDGEVFAVPCK